MSWRSIQRISCLVLPALYLLFVVTSSIGIIHMSTQMTHGGLVHECPFAKSIAVCDMTLPEHLSAWKSVFATLGLSEISLLVFSVLLTVFISHALSRQAFLPRTRYREPARRYILDLRPFSRALQEAFSDGILHSKAY